MMGWCKGETKFGNVCEARELCRKYQPTFSSIIGWEWPTTEMALGTCEHFEVENDPYRAAQHSVDMRTDIPVDNAMVQAANVASIAAHLRSSYVVVDTVEDLYRISQPEEGAMCSVVEDQSTYIFDGVYWAKLEAPIGYAMQFTLDWLRNEHSVLDIDDLCDIDEPVSGQMVWVEEEDAPYIYGYSGWSRMNRDWRNHDATM